MLGNKASCLIIIIVIFIVDQHPLQTQTVRNPRSLASWQFAYE